MTKTVKTADFIATINARAASPESGFVETQKAAIAAFAARIAAQEYVSPSSVVVAWHETHRAVAERLSSDGSYGVGMTEHASRATLLELVEATTPDDFAKAVEAAFPQYGTKRTDVFNIPAGSWFSRTER